MNIPRLRYEAKVTAVDGEGRAKVKFLENNFEPNLYLQTATTVYGEGQEGLHSKLAVNDIVIVSFKDYPQNQHPFIEYKLQKQSERYDASSNDTMMWKEHTIVFKDDALEISHQDGTKITIEGGKISLSSSATFSKVNLGSVDLIDYLKNHTHDTGNLGFPTGPATIYGAILIPFADFTLE